jgi:hypothetical protein
LSSHLVSLLVRGIFVMEGVRKLARSGSVRVEEMFNSKNRENGREEVEDNDTDTPTKLPILRSFNTKRKVETEREKELDNSINGNIYTIISSFFFLT